MEVDGGVSSPVPPAATEAVDDRRNWAVRKDESNLRTLALENVDGGGGAAAEDDMPPTSDDMRRQPSALLRELAKQKRRRFDVQELINKEKDYVHNLHIAVYSIMNPLLALDKDPKHPTILPTPTIRKIFRNISMILDLNKKLLTALTNTRGVEHKVGKIFCKFADFFKMYSAYCAGVDESTELVHNLENSNKLFSKFVRKVVHAVSGGSLKSLLITPVQLSLIHI